MRKILVTKSKRLLTNDFVFSTKQKYDNISFDEKVENQKIIIKSQKRFAKLFEFSKKIRITLFAI